MTNFEIHLFALYKTKGKFKIILFNQGVTLNVAFPHSPICDCMSAINATKLIMTVWTV